MRRTYVHAIWAWVVFYILAVANGFLRESLYVPSLGDLWGRLAGTAVLAVVVLIVVYAFLRGAAGSLNRMHLYVIGVLWVALSALFELTVTRYVLGIPWETLYPLYNIMTGGTRGVIWLVELLAPIVMGYRMLGRRDAKALAGRAGPPAAKPAGGGGAAASTPGAAEPAADKPKPTPASPQSDEEPAGV